MVRAIFFDFYSVWAPDKIEEYLQDASVHGPQKSINLRPLIQQYYHGMISLADLASALSSNLGRPDITETSLTFSESDISPAVANLMRVLHGHFVKLGILGNLGRMELELLNNFNASQQLFEAILCPLSLDLAQPLLSKEVFDKALQTIGEPPASCLVISGHGEYLTFAKNYGMQTIKYAGLIELGHSLGQLLAKDIPSFVIPPEPS